MDHKVTVGIDTRNDLLKREVTFQFVERQMREEMDLAWKDFFEKNPGKKEEDLWRRVEERLRSKQNSKYEDKEAFALRRREKIAPLILKRRIW